MAAIAPFRGILYAPERAGDFSRIVAPPYDVITPQQQEELYRQHPYNIVRLILGKETARDDIADNRYSRAALDYSRWLRQGILRRDPVPALYAYEQTFRIEDGSIVRRLGFLAVGRLEDFASGAVLPHERTLSGPKADRMRLLETCRANFCPIFALYSDPAGLVQSVLEEGTRQAAAIAFSDEAGISHRLWRLVELPVIEAVCRSMADKVLYIADGHHRYETALAYRDALRRQSNGTGNEPYQYILMYIASMDAPGIIILPFHRLLAGLEDFRAADFLERLQGCFRVVEWPAADRRQALPAFLGALAERGRHDHVFGMGMPRDERFYLIEIERSRAGSAIRRRLAPVVKQLDVTVLHELVLRELLGIRTGALRRQRHIRYIPHAGKTLEELDREPSQVAFWLNPTRIDEVKVVAQERETMPQKSTYFYPKPTTGLVIHPLDVPEPILPVGVLRDEN